LSVEELQLEVSDGFRIAARHWKPTNDRKRSILCVHGMGAYSGTMQNLGQALAKEGSDVYAIDLRGFGKSREAKLEIGDVSSFERHLRDVENIVDSLRKKNAGKVYMLGHSNGGALTVWFTANHPGVLDGIILIAPAVELYTKLSTGKRMGLFFALLFAPRSRFDLLTIFPGWDRTEEYRVLVADPLITMETSVRFAVGSERTLGKTQQNGLRVQIPTLIIQGELDRHVSAEGTKKLFATIPIKDKRLETYPDAEHFFYRMLLPLPAEGEPLEKQAKVLATINIWLEQHTSVRLLAGRL